MRFFAQAAPASPQVGDFWFQGGLFKYHDGSAVKTITVT
jgi:hypothetical protein